MGPRTDIGSENLEKKGRKERVNIDIINFF